MAKSSRKHYQMHFLKSIIMLLQSVSFDGVLDVNQSETFQVK